MLVKVAGESMQSVLKVNPTPILILLANSHLAPFLASDLTLTPALKDHQQTVG